MQMLEVLCHVLGSVSYLHASKTSSPSVVYAEALCQSLVKSAGFPLPLVSFGLGSETGDKQDVTSLSDFTGSFPVLERLLLCCKTSSQEAKNSPVWEALALSSASASILV